MQFSQTLKTFQKQLILGCFFTLPVPLQVRGIFYASQMDLENLIYRKLNTSVSTRAFQLVRHDLKRASENFDSCKRWIAPVLAMTVTGLMILP